MAELGEGFYPYQATIDGYGNGGFRFAGMSHRGSILCLPSGIYGWDEARFDELLEEQRTRAREALDRIHVYGGAGKGRGGADS